MLTQNKLYWTFFVFITALFLKYTVSVFHSVVLVYLHLEVHVSARCKLTLCDQITNVNRLIIRHITRKASSLSVKILVPHSKCINVSLLWWHLADLLVVSIIS